MLGYRITFDALNELCSRVMSAFGNVFMVYLKPVKKGFVKEAFHPPTEKDLKKILAISKT